MTQLKPRWKYSRSGTLNLSRQAVTDINTNKKMYDASEQTTVAGSCGKYKRQYMGTGGSETITAEPCTV